METLAAGIIGTAWEITDSVWGLRTLFGTVYNPRGYGLGCLHKRIARLDCYHVRRISLLLDIT